MNKRRHSNVELIIQAVLKYSGNKTHMWHSLTETTDRHVKKKLLCIYQHLSTQLKTEDTEETETLSLSQTSPDNYIAIIQAVCLFLSVVSLQLILFPKLHF